MLREIRSLDNWLTTATASQSSTRTCPSKPTDLLLEFDLSSSTRRRAESVRNYLIRLEVISLCRTRRPTGTGEHTMQNGSPSELTNRPQNGTGRWTVAKVGARAAASTVRCGVAAPGRASQWLGQVRVRVSAASAAQGDLEPPLCSPAPTPTPRLSSVTSTSARPARVARRAERSLSAG